MKKNKVDTKTDDGSMIAQKTNEDFNNKQPLPIDFKDKKAGANNKISSVGPATKLKKIIKGK